MWPFASSKRLPLLDYTADLFPDSDLSGALLIGCQHLLGSMVNMVEALFQKGLTPDKTFLLGKCYSTNSKVAVRLRKLGAYISPLSLAYDSQQSFDEQFQASIQQFIGDVLIKEKLDSHKKVIILDDGAGLLLYMNDFAEESKNIVGIEQTSSGYWRLKQVKLRYGVVNIARSRAKLMVESPMIAEVVVKELEKYFKHKNISAPNILVVGQGAIGKEIAYDLKKFKHRVEVYDLTSHQMAFPGVFEEKLADFDVIVGTTGQTILQPGEFAKLRKPVHLISASSSDREFSAVYLRRAFGQSQDCHADIEINGIHLANSGFPINFTGSEHSVPPEKIQLTRALLLAGVLQAANSKMPSGMNDLDEKAQAKIMRKFRNG